MIHKIGLILFVFFAGTSHILAQTNNQIEIFDIENGTVIKTIPINSSLQAEVEHMLKNINEVYKKINPIPKKGMMAKIPLNPMIPVENQWMHSLIDEVIIFFPEEEEPYVMTYDDENNFYFFTLTDSQLPIDFLIKMFNLP